MGICPVSSMTHILFQCLFFIFVSSYHLTEIGTVTISAPIVFAYIDLLSSKH